MDTQKFGTTIPRWNYMMMKLEFSLKSKYMEWDIHVWVVINKQPFLLSLISYHMWKTGSCHDSKFVITGDTGDCYYDNLQCPQLQQYYSDVIMGAMASHITSLSIVYSTVYSSADERKHQSSTSLTLVWGIHWWLGNSPHKGPVTQKMFSFDEVIMKCGIMTTQCCSVL